LETALKAGGWCGGFRGSARVIVDGGTAWVAARGDLAIATGGCRGGSPRLQSGTPFRGSGKAGV